MKNHLINVHLRWLNQVKKAVDDDDDGGDEEDGRKEGRKDRKINPPKKSTKAKCRARIHSVLSTCQLKKGWLVLLGEVIRPERKNAE